MRTKDYWQAAESSWRKLKAKWQVIGPSQHLTLRRLVGLFICFVAVSVALVFLLSVLGWLRTGGDRAVAQECRDPATVATGAEAVVAEKDGLLPRVDAFVLAAAAEVVAAVDAAAVDAANAANAGWHEIDGARYYYFADGTLARGVAEIDAVQVTFDDEGRWVSSRLDVPYISQLPEMPSGCEIVSVTMMLNHAGIDVSKEDAAAQLPYSNDPSQGFTGSVYDAGGYGYGGIVWPSALVELVRGYQGSAVDLTEASWETVRGFVDEGRPVCIWFTEGGLDHTVLLVGYSENTVWVNDPLAAKDTTLELEVFFQLWAQNGYRALSYE
jgi:uncharacterized protein YvpB